MNLKEVAEHISEVYTYNEIIPMEILEELLGIKFPEFASVNILQQVQIRRMAAIEGLCSELLLNHSLMLRNVRGVGYKVIHPAEQVSVSMADGQQKIAKELRKVTRRVSNVRVDELTHEQAGEQEDALAKLAAIRKLSRKM